MLYMTEKEECSPYPGDIYFLGYGPSTSKDHDDTIVIEDEQATIPETVSRYVNIENTKSFLKFVIFYVSYYYKNANVIMLKSI